MKKTTTDAYERVNSVILSLLEQGIVPFADHSRLNVDSSRSYVSGKPYSLLNCILLGAPGYYITFNEVKAQGGSIRPGAKGRRVCFFKMLEKTDPNTDDKNGNPLTSRIPLLKDYFLFNIEDAEGIKPREAVTIPTASRHINDIDDILRAFFLNQNISLELRPVTLPGYDEANDRILISPLSSYNSSVDYYKDLLYETIHATCTSRRTARQTAEPRNMYEVCLEDLVCQIGSTYLCACLGIDTIGVYKYTAAQIASLQRRLTEHKRLFVTATCRAEKAARFVLEHAGAC